MRSHRTAAPTPIRRLLPVALAAAVALLAALPLASQTVDWTARKDGPPIDGNAQPGSGDWIRGKRALAVDGSGNVYVTGSSSKGVSNDYLTVAYDASGNELWARVKNGAGNGTDKAYALAVDGSGNVYVTGYSSNGANWDYLTVAYDASGTELWAKVKNGAANSHDQAIALAVDGSGNVYVTGNSHNGSNFDYLTVAYDGDGNELWARVKNGAANGPDQANALAVDGSGNVYVTGYSSNGSTNDYLTVAYDASGTERWAKVRNGAANGSDQANALAVDGSGNVYVTGYSSNGSNSDYLTVAYDTSGNELWARVQNGAANSVDAAHALAVDDSGNVYVTGYSSNGANNDYLTVAYDASGNELWVKVKDGTANGFDQAFAVALDESGNVYVTGYSHNGANYDYLTVAYDASGNELWARVRNGAANSTDEAYALAVDGSGNVYVTGCSHNGANWDFLTVAYDASGNELWDRKEPPTGGLDDHVGGGHEIFGKRALALDGSGNAYVTGSSSNGANSDYLTVAYGASGTELWAKVKNGAANRDDVGYALAVDGNGNIYVTGYSHNGGNDDFLTVAYDASGNELWAKVKNGAANGNDYAVALAVGGNGNVYVTGCSHNGANYDSLTVAYDASGNELWAKVKNGAANGPDQAYALAVDGSGNVYVTGYSSNGANNDYLTVAYDAGGTELWAQVKNGAADHTDFANALAVDGNGNVYVTGISFNGSNWDYLTVAYDASGNELWAQVIDGAANSNDQAVALAVGGNGDVYVTGYSHNGANYDYLTIAYDANGNELWAQVKNGAANGSDQAFALAVGGDGTVYVTGHSSNGVTQDYLTVAYDANGNEHWDLSIDDGGADHAYAVAADLAGGIVVSGSSIGCSWDFFTARISTDMTPPTDPAIGSTAPPTSSWSSDAAVEVTWSGAADESGGSGLAGYSVLFDENPSTQPDATVEVPHTADPHGVTSDPLADGTWYFHLSTCDLAGNCTATVHAGPFLIDATAPSAPGAVTSASHGDGQPKSDATIDIAWGAASDNLSGVALYRHGFTGSLTQPPCASLGETTAATSATSAALADGTWYAHVCAVDGAGNEGAVATGGPFAIDTGAPTGLMVSSTSHLISAWSNDVTIDFGFSGAADPNGIAGYSVVFDQLPGTEPDTAVDQTGTAHTATAASDGSDWHLHVRACDTAGNCGATVHAGPYWIDTGAPSATGAVTSASHGDGQPKSDPTIEIAWSAATDGLSGVAFYFYGFSPSSSPPSCGTLSSTTTSLSAVSAPQADGTWYAHVCAEDGAGNGGPVTTGGPYAIDTVPPQVTSVSTVRDTGDGTLGQGEVTGASITQLYLTFDKAMAGPVTTPGSYRVTSAGPDLVLETAGCGPLLGDDLAMAIASVAYDGGARRAAVRLAASTSLPVGLYGAAGCAALTDAAGNALDGDGDGTGGDDFVRLFGVEVTNLLSNPNFDADLAVWSGPAVWGGADADGKPTSGSARIQTATATGTTLTESQCRAIVPGASYRAAGAARVETATPGAPGASIWLRFHAGSACGGAPLASAAVALASGSTAGEWAPGELRGVESPAGAESVRFSFAVAEGAAPAYAVDLDLPLLAEDLDLLDDGFESGGLDAWGGAAP